MAQIREFESTTESYFILDGVSYPKVYEAMLDNGYSDTKIKLVGTNRDTTPLVFSTQYTNIRVDGDSFDTALEAISRLNQIVFSKGGGSGTGGATNVITEDSDTVAFTGNGTAGTPLKAEVKSDGLDYIPLTGTEEGKPVTGPIESNQTFSTYPTLFTNQKNLCFFSNKEGEYYTTGYKGSVFRLYQSEEISIYNQRGSDEDGNSEGEVISMQGNGLNSSISITATNNKNNYPSLRQVSFIVNTNENSFIVSAIGVQSKGIIGDVEFNKQGDRKAFAQLSDVYDNAGIPLTGTEEGKPVTGIIETAEDVKIGYKNGNSYSLVQFGEGYSQLSMGIEDLPTTGFDVMSANITASNLIGDDYYSGIKVQTEQKLDSVLTLGVGLFSMNDYSQIEPENKLIYAQRSYVDKAISNIDFSPKFSEIVIEAETDGIEIPITGGTYMVYNFRGQTVYRYMTTATNTNGYPIEDSFYATLTAGVLSNKITQRNQ